MDTIEVLGLKAHTIIGVHPWEREHRQTLVIDVAVFTETAQAAGTDNLAETISYGDVARCIKAFVESSRYQLLEALAEDLATELLRAFNPARIRLTIGKPGAVPFADTVRLTIERPG